MMASHLFVALAGGGLLLQAGALEQGVLAELAAHGYERFLQVPFFILGLSVVEKRDGGVRFGQQIGESDAQATDGNITAGPLRRTGARSAP